MFYPKKQRKKGSEGWKGVKRREKRAKAELNPHVLIVYIKNKRRNGTRSKNRKMIKTTWFHTVGKEGL